MIKRKATVKSKPFGCDDIVIPAGRIRDIFKKKLTKEDGDENQKSLTEFLNNGNGSKVHSRKLINLSNQASSQQKKQSNTNFQPLKPDNVSPSKVKYSSLFEKIKNNNNKINLERSFKETSKSPILISK